MTTELQEKISQQIRLALEMRLAQAFKIEPKDLPPLSISEMVSLIFGLWGQTNSLGNFSEMLHAILALIKDDFWCRPKPKAEESVSPTVQ